MERCPVSLCVRLELRYEIIGGVFQTMKRQQRCRSRRCRCRSALQHVLQVGDEQFIVVIFAGQER